MTGQPVPYRLPAVALPGQAHPAAPGRAGELPPGQCIRCGAVGTHYLTCPSLRLPSGYRLSEDQRA